MLKKATTTSEPVRLVLLADPAVWEAQLVAAREEVDRELTETAEKGDFIDRVIQVMRATTNTHGEMVEALASLRGGARELIAQILVDEESQEMAQSRIDEALQDEDTRQALAFVRAHGAASAYRESSNPEHLMDRDPEGASWVELRGLSRAQTKEIERAMMARPGLGALLSSRALDAARRAARRGEDSTEAYARFVSTLTLVEQDQIKEYEIYSEQLDREVFRASVHKVEGFDIERGEHGYPVEEFLEQCVDAEEVISEAARHARQVIALDPKAVRRSSSPSGTSESEKEDRA